jgi:hypothetical protein
MKVGEMVFVRGSVAGEKDSVPQATQASQRVSVRRIVRAVTSAKGRVVMPSVALTARAATSARGRVPIRAARLTSNPSLRGEVS